jgi:hypothetical protein
MLVRSLLRVLGQHSLFRLLLQRPVPSINPLDCNALRTSQCPLRDLIRITCGSTEAVEGRRVQETLSSDEGKETVCV